MKYLLIGAILLYKRVLRPAMEFIVGPGGWCRYQPTCSSYCLEAIQMHGAAKGVFLGVKRLLRCHPWGKAGYDPVPPRSRRAA